jgi:hypothetical protein
MAAPTARAILEPSGFSPSVSQRRLWELDYKLKKRVKLFMIYITKTIQN